MQSWRSRARALARPQRFAGNDSPCDKGGEKAISKSAGHLYLRKQVAQVLPIFITRVFLMGYLNKYMLMKTDAAKAARCRGSNCAGSGGEKGSGSQAEAAEWNGLAGGGGRLRSAGAPPPAGSRGSGVSLQGEERGLN